jgi:hypothetical protein
VLVHWSYRAWEQSFSLYDRSVQMQQESCLIPVFWNQANSFHGVESFREANRSSACPGIPCILWNSKVHYLIHNSPPPIHILSQINPVHAPPTHLLNTYFNTVLQSTPLSSKWFLPSGLLAKTLYTPLLSPLCATCSAHHFMILSSEWHLLRCTDHKALCYVVFPTPFLLCPS